MPSLTPKKISELDLAGTLSGQEYFPLVQSGQTKKAQLDTINAFNDGSCKCTLINRTETIINDADTTEQFFHTFTLDSNTLVNQGDRLEIRATGYCGATNDNKTIKLYFGSAVFSSFSAPVNNKAWELNATITRESLTAQHFVASIEAKSVLVNWGLTSPTSYTEPNITCTETLSTDIQIALSGQTDVAQSSDIVVETFTIELHKLDPDS